MRIIAGKFRGRKLPKLSFEGVRPTSDRTRESVFSALQSLVDLEGARVIDLFAGTGAFGFEALSRGAAQVCFVERNRRAASYIGDFARSLGVEGQTQLLNSDVFKVFNEDSVLGTEPVNLIFADPPYGAQIGEKLLRSICACPQINEESLFVFEDSNSLSLIDPDAGNFTPKLLKERRLGSTVLSYLLFERR